MRELKRSRKLEVAGHKSLTGSPLVDKYSKAILDINKFNIQLRDSLFGMVSIINETSPDNQEVKYKGKSFDELEVLANESIDAIKECLSDCYGVIARFKAILHRNQSIR